MSTIELSAGFMEHLPARILMYGEDVDTYPHPSIGRTGIFLNGNDSYNKARGFVYLMKGAVPTDFNDIVDFSSRSADVLCTWEVRTGALSLIQENVNPAVLSSTYQNASASGTATWLWITTRPAYMNDSQDTLYHQIIATVGVTGSGADLEIATTTVVSGAPYRFLNLRINFPASWSY